MAIEVSFVPGATTSNCSLPAWAPDIMCMATTTVAGWGIINSILAFGTTSGMTVTTRATTYTTRTFNAKVPIGADDAVVHVVYNKVNEFVRT